MFHYYLRGSLFLLVHIKFSITVDGTIYLYHFGCPMSPLGVWRALKTVLVIKYFRLSILAFSYLLSISANMVMHAGKLTYVNSSFLLLLLLMLHGNLISIKSNAVVTLTHGPCMWIVQKEKRCIVSYKSTLFLKVCTIWAFTHRHNQPSPKVLELKSI